MRKRFVFDLETDNLLQDLTKVHLIVMYDLDAEELLVYREDRAKEAVRLLMNAEFICGHNIIAFDIPALEKLFPWFSPQGMIRDTLVMARIVCSNIKEKDFELNRKGLLPGKYIGANSLAAWGYRLGEHKAEFGDGGVESWAVWTQEMEDYARQDVVVTVTLYDWLCDQIRMQQFSETAISFEHRFADLAAQMERNGYPFDEESARTLYATLSVKREELTTELRNLFRPWWKPKWKTVEGTNKKTGKTFKKPVDPWGEDAAETFTPQKTLTYKNPMQASRVADAPFCPVELVEFNPGSRDMIADRLQRLFGWVPKEFTNTEKPKVSEDILRDLVGVLDADEDGIEESEEELYEKFVRAIPQAKSLADFFLIQKRIGQLAEGKNGWLKLVRDGKVHGSINTLGARSARVTHAKPNMSQCPAVRSPYGWEMRDLWTTRVLGPDWTLLGCDLSGVELRCFSESLAEFDGGEYARLVVEGDIHTVNAQAFGLMEMLNPRDLAKTAIYATLYGAGDLKIGSIVGGGADEGKVIKQNFMRAVPAYKKLVTKLKRQNERFGWIPALDGRRLYVDYEHKLLNMSLQSAGALIAKDWAMRIEDNLIDAGMEHGWKGDFAALGFFHDEVGIAIRVPGFHADSYVDTFDYSVFGEDKKAIKAAKESNKKEWFLQSAPKLRLFHDIVKKSVKETERHFNYGCPLDCDVKLGRSWAEVH